MVNLKEKGGKKKKKYPSPIKWSKLLSLESGNKLLRRDYIRGGGIDTHQKEGREIE